MSADYTLNAKFNTDNGSTHAVMMLWAAKVLESPGYKMTREMLLSALESDDKAEKVVAEIKKKIKRGSNVWIIEAAAGRNEAGPEVSFAVRYG